MGVILDTDKVVCAETTNVLLKIQYNTKRPSFITFIPMDIAHNLELKDGDQIQWLLMEDRTVHVVIKQKHPNSPTS